MKNCVSDFMSTRYAHGNHFSAAGFTVNRLSALCTALFIAPSLQAQSSYAPITQGSAGLYPLTQSPALINSSSIVAKIVVEVARNAIPADGQTATPVTVRLLDNTGQLLRTPMKISVEISAGRIQLPGATTDELGPGRLDLDPAQPGIQLQAQNGSAQFLLLAPFEPQDVKVRVTVDGQEAQGLVSFVPELRDMIAAGLIEGVINFRNKNVLETNRPNDGFERELRAWERQFNDGKNSAAARIAFFVKGVVKGQTLLTAAYDSDKDTQSRLLRDIDPEEFYPVYGDASIRGSDVNSSQRLYVRLDHGKHYLMYGDFQTGDGFSQSAATPSTALLPSFNVSGGAVAPQQLRALGNYSRSATGIRGHYEQGRGLSNVFVTRDSLRQVIQEFPSQGSGPYAVRGGDAVEDSEKVEVLIRDRNNPSLILNVRALTRLADYNFEPFSGRLILTQPLPAFDANLNPVSLRITYEVDQGGEQFWVFGLDGQWRLTERLEIGGSYVADQNPQAQYRLGSVNVGAQLGEKTFFVAELARTETDSGASITSPFGSPALQNVLGTAAGNAWRVALTHEKGAFNASLNAGRSDTEFFNPSAPFNAGKGEAKARTAYQLNPAWTLYAEAVRSEDRNTDNGVEISDQSGAQLGATVKLTEKFTLNGGVRYLRESAGKRVIATSPFSDTSGLSGSIASGGSGGFYGFGNSTQSAITGLGGLANYSANAFDAADATTLRLGLGFQATDKWRLGAEAETDISGAQRDQLALGTDYQITDRTKLYGRFERQTGLGSLYEQTTDASAGNVFAAGVASTVWRDTQLFSEYRLRDAVNGRDIQQASGIRNSWEIAEGLRLGGALEYVNSLTQNAPDALAVSGTFDYSAHPLWRLANKLEYRRSDDYQRSIDDISNDAFNTWLWQFMVARKLDRDWTLLARNYLLRTDYQARGDILQDRVQFGLAYRDTDTNRVNALLKYEFKYEDDQSGLGTPAGVTVPDGGFKERAHIVSGHADYHPSRPWWSSTRLANKWSQGSFENGVNTRYRGTLASGRVVYDITEKWDLGLIGSAFNDNSSGTQYGVGLEAGYLLQQNLWLSAGYNFTGFEADRDLSGGDYTNQGLYIRLRFKFDETLFASNNKRINPSLDR